MSDVAVQRTRLFASSRNLLPEERLDRLVHALAQLPDRVSATIWADGPDRLRVERLARAYALGDRLTFIDGGPADEAARLVFPSPLNLERARVSARDGLAPPIRFDPDGPFAPHEGRVRTFGELIESLYRPDDPPASYRRCDDMLNGERVAVVSSLPTHYRVPLFNIVAARLRDAGATFRAIFLALGRADRDEWMRLGDVSFEYEVTRSAFPLVREIGRRVPLDLLHRLRTLDPTIVVSGGLSLPVSGQIGLWAKRRSTAFGIWSGETSTTAAQRRRARLVGRRTIARAARFGVSYGSASDEYLQRLNPHLPVIHARNSTPFSPSLPAHHAPGVSEKRPVNILTVGRAFPGKGLDLPVRAIRRRPDLDCTLTVIGSGPELANVRAAAAGDERVLILGAVPSAEVLDYFTAADIFVFPSQIDVFGLVFVEALGAGLGAIVSRKVGSVADLAVDGENCLIVDGTNPEEWACSLEMLVTSTELRRRLGNAGAATANRRWTIEHSADAYVAALRLGASLRKAAE